MKGILVAGLVFIIVGIALIVIGVTSSPIYSGEKVFNTEADYVQFKRILVSGIENKTISDWGVSALTSEPPILVKFSVVSKSFPYGNRDKTEKWALSGAGGLMIFFGTILVATSFIPEEKEARI